MTIRLHGGGRERLSLVQYGQHALGLVLGILFASVLVRRLEAGEERDGP